MTDNAITMTWTALSIYLLIGVAAATWMMAAYEKQSDPDSIAGQRALSNFPRWAVYAVFIALNAPIWPYSVVTSIRIGFAQEDDDDR